MSTTQSLNNINNNTLTASIPSNDHINAFQATTAIQSEISSAINNQKPVNNQPQQQKQKRQRRTKINPNALNNNINNNNNNNSDNNNDSNNNINELISIGSEQNNDNNNNVAAKTKTRANRPKQYVRQGLVPFIHKKFDTLLEFEQLHRDNPITELLLMIVTKNQFWYYCCSGFNQQKQLVDTIRDELFKIVSYNCNDCNDYNNNRNNSNFDLNGDAVCITPRKRIKSSAKKSIIAAVALNTNDIDIEMKTETSINTPNNGDNDNVINWQNEPINSAASYSELNKFTITLKNRMLTELDKRNGDPLNMENQCCYWALTRNVYSDFVTNYYSENVKLVIEPSIIELTQQFSENQRKLNAEAQWRNAAIVNNYKLTDIADNNNSNSQQKRRILDGNEDSKGVAIVKDSK